MSLIPGTQAQARFRARIQFGEVFAGSAHCALDQGKLSAKKICSQKLSTNITSPQELSARIIISEKLSAKIIISQKNILPR